jgi:hypothetical protein
LNSNTVLNLVLVSNTKFSTSIDLESYAKLPTNQPTVLLEYQCSAPKSHYTTVGLLLNGGSFSKASAPPFFLEDENIFQKSATMVPILLKFRVVPLWPIFENVLIFKKTGG